MRGIFCALCIIMLFLKADGQVKRPLIIARTSGNITFPGGKHIRIYGFAAKLNEPLDLPGATIVATEGDSMEIDLWNVSQGNPHDLQIKGINLQKRNEPHEVYTDDNIHHMEHGYYSFVAPHTGTYIYYCPVNYPLDVQAGMFGILQVKPKENNKLYNDHSGQELLWCGFEVDTTWHTDDVLDAERAETSKMTEQLPYRPQYFLINNKRNGLPAMPAKLKGKIGETVLIRLANAGFMQHIIKFPKEIKCTVLTKNAMSQASVDTANTLILKPMDTYEILVSSDQMINGFISYEFREENQAIPPTIKKIPVSITK